MLIIVFYDFFGPLLRFWKAVNNLWSKILNTYFYLPQKSNFIFKNKLWQFFFMGKNMWWDKLSTLKMALNLPFISSVCRTRRNRSRSWFWFLFHCLCLNSWTRTWTRVFQSDLTRNTLQHHFKSFLQRQNKNPTEASLMDEMQKQHVEWFLETIRQENIWLMQRKCLISHLVNFSVTQCNVVISSSVYNKGIFSLSVLCVFPRWISWHLTR